MSQPPASPPAPSAVQAWEDTFAAGLVAAEPWVAGHVHVVRGLPDQPDPVPTGGLSFHQLIVPLTSGYVTEGVATGPPQHDGFFAPGDVTVASLDMGLADVRTAWSSTGSKGFGVISVLLPPAVMAEACRAAGLDYAAVEWCDRFPGTDAVLDALVRALGAEAEAGGPGGRVYAETIAAALAAHLLRGHSVQEGRPETFTGGLTVRQRRASEALAHARLADADLALADLAAAAGLSAFHFSREYKRTTGQAPFAMLRRLRLDRAARLLRETARPVVTVGLEVGYGSAGAFATAFKRHHGASPTAYRRLAR